MKRYFQIARQGVIVVSLLCGALTFVGTGASAMTQPSRSRGAAAALTTVDWANFTYQSACFADKPATYHAVKGLAFLNGVHFQAYTPLYGDINGDGNLEAVVPIACTGADFGGVHLLVYTGTASSPKLAGEIPGAGHEADITSVQKVVFPALAVLPQARVLTVMGTGYSAKAIHTCPDLAVTASFTLVAGHLHQLSLHAVNAKGCLSL